MNPLFSKVKDAKNNSAKEIQKSKLREATFKAAKLSRPCCGSKTGQNIKKSTYFACCCLEKSKLKWQLVNSIPSWTTNYF